MTLTEAKRIARGAIPMNSWGRALKVLISRIDAYEYDQRVRNHFRKCL